MGFYNVVTVPCVVGKLHHVRPTTAPIEVDDDLAAPLVESGHLERYQPGGGEAGAVLDDEFGVTVGLPALEAGGSTLSDDLLDRIRAAEGTILGPCDTYAYPPKQEGGVNPSATIRKELDLFANIRPSRSRKGVPSAAAGMDLVMARENTEGFYADRNMFQGSGEFMPTEDVALAVRKITREGSRRIARVAFDLAQGRRGKVTMVHKANVLKVSDGLFRDTVREVAKSHPEVELDEVLIDAMAALLVRTPEAFDVVLTTNMFGDILSDEAAELSGGLGLGDLLSQPAEIRRSHARQQPARFLTK